MIPARGHKTKPELNDRNVDLSAWAFEPGQMLSSYSIYAGFEPGKQEVQ